MGLSKAYSSDRKYLRRTGSRSSRVLLYVLLRHLRPQHCLETGVYYGGNTAFMLAALNRNGFGKLTSVDLPDVQIRKDQGTERHPLVGDSELYAEALSPGFIVPGYLRPSWTFIEGDSHRVIPRLEGPFDFYIHDSDHSFGFVNTEMTLVRPRLTPKAVVVVDDIDWSNGFFAFCLKEHLHPLLLTDNGKDNLRQCASASRNSIIQTTTSQRLRASQHKDARHSARRETKS